jgi:hypothetical protein
MIKTVGSATLVLRLCFSFDVVLQPAAQPDDEARDADPA